MRESERLRARLREITTLAATMTFRAEGTVAQEAPVLAADAIAALERAEARVAELERERDIAVQQRDAWMHEYNRLDQARRTTVLSASTTRTVRQEATDGA